MKIKSIMVIIFLVFSLHNERGWFQCFVGMYRLQLHGD